MKPATREWIRCVVSRGFRGAGDHKKATSRTPDGKMPGESSGTPRDIQRYLCRISGPLLDRQLWT
jgi:hypothetical protein